MELPNQRRHGTRFGVFEVDLRTGELRKRGHKVALQEKPFKILAALLRNPGTVITRGELRREVWPEDTFVDFDNGLNTAVNKIREALGDSAESPRFVETLARRGYRFIAPVSAPEKPICSLAVLPLANYSGDPAAEYLADGMTEALICSLARIKSLKVISRTSAMRYKGSPCTLPEIARELSVDAVVEGSVQQREDKIMVSAQLIEASSDQHLWADQYERPMRDVLSLQTEIATAIARQISATVEPQGDVQPSSRNAIQPQAYRDYLQGRYFLNRRDPVTIGRAVEYFQKVLQECPEFAPAYSNIAEALMWQIVFADAAPQTAFATAKRNALRALELDKTLATAHIALGFIQRVCDYDLPGGSAEYERALDLEPGNATAHQLYGVHLAFMGQHQAAEAQLRMALDLDPFSLSAHADAGWIYYLARRYDLAIDTLLRALEKDPEYPIARYRLGFAYERKGMLQDATAQFEILVRASRGTLRPQAWLARQYALTGRREEAERIAETLVGRHRESGFWGSLIALVFLALGKPKEAITWLYKASEQHDPNLIALLVDPICDGVRSNPQFSRLFKRMGLRMW